MRRTSRLLLDVGLLVGFLVASTPSVTGVGFHEWLSVGIATGVLVHLVVNWEWAVRTARRLFEKARLTPKVNLVVDALLFVATVTVMLSGMMISQSVAAVFGLTVDAETIWRLTHSASAIATAGLLALHTALHARWFAAAYRDLVLPSLREVTA